jgi:hypothetical protein
MVHITATVTATELELVIEALAARASRLESYSRAKPHTAAARDRKAETIRRLRARLMQLKIDAEAA